MHQEYLVKVLLVVPQDLQVQTVPQDIVDLQVLQIHLVLPVLPVLQVHLVQVDLQVEVIPKFVGILTG